VFLRGLWQSVLVFGYGAAFVVPLASQSQEAKRSFDLPADTAEKTLKLYSQQSGRALIMSATAVQRIRTNAVRGKFTPREALDLVLVNTGLEAVEDAESGSLAIRKETNGESKNGRKGTQAPPGDNVSDSQKKNETKTATTQEPVKKTKLLTQIAAVLTLMVAPPAHAQVAPGTGAAAESMADASTRGDPVVLSIFQVTGEKDEGYRSTQTTSGSRTLSNLRDTPNSISVLNRELLDDLMATKLGDAMFFSITGEIDTNSERSNEDFIFRGIVTAVRLRNGITWWGATSDTYNIERGEILRGPQAFLYGEGSAGGVMNQQTKQANFRDSQNLKLMFGSNDLYRAELDVNRRLGKKVAVRLALVAQHENAFQHYTGRDFYGAFGTVNYRPFRNTNINFELEYRLQDGVMPANTLTEQFSTTARTPTAGSTLSATNSGRTFIPALGLIFDGVGQRRSAGRALVLDDERIWPREFNFLGPNSTKSSKERTASINIDQKVAENFNVSFNFTYIDIEKYTTERTGGSASSVYRDLNPTLPGGAPNPYFNELYTEYYHRRINSRNFINSSRLTGVYDLKLPFTHQKIVGSVLYNEEEPYDFRYSEFVDPASGNFKGTLRSDNSLAAYQANNAVLGQNFFYRRFYLKDGDGAALTKGGAIAGESVILRDPVSDGNSGRSTDRTYFTPAVGAGIDGSYFGGRVHSLVGWRRSKFKQDPNREFYNATTGEIYRLPTTPAVHTKVTRDSFNYGAIVYPSKMVGLYYNYAESILLSNGLGGAQLKPGELRGPGQGDGHEAGLRWMFLGGRLESNWTYYVSKNLRNNVNPGIPNLVRQTELGPIFGDEINPSGNDTQSSRSRGIEVETTANITKAWRLTWNIAKTEVDLSDRYPLLKGFQAAAKARNIPTPETDAFLSSVPDGTPLPGFTKWRSNLVTMYRFQEGPLKNFSIGGAVQYRDKSYRGNFDRDLDGDVEQLWSPGYTLYTLMTGYRTKIMNRNVDFSLNIYNLTNKDYFRSFSLFSGAWGDRRSFRFATNIRL
jgi:outer membrane receptor protein involved in Fe transport